MRGKKNTTTEKIFLRYLEKFKPYKVLPSHPNEPFLKDRGLTNLPLLNGLEGESLGLKMLEMSLDRNKNIFMSLKNYCVNNLALF